MQLLCDAISALGSRHSLLLNPHEGQITLLRFSLNHALPMRLHAGLRVGEYERVFPLHPEGERFAFFDQRMSPCTSRFIAIDTETGLKVTLTIFSPFRPRDVAFSTTPVIQFRLEAEQLPGNFRWTKPSLNPDAIELFLAVDGDAVTATPNAQADAIDLYFNTTVRSSNNTGEHQESPLPQHDRLVALSGSRAGLEFSRRLRFDANQPAPLEVAWCTWSDPVMTIDDAPARFKYTDHFDSLDHVANWARQHPAALPSNAENVDRIVAQNSLGRSINNLLAQSLHSWLISTWYTVDATGRDCYTCREGICGCFSTVDVEFTQSPFYLAVWPELLALELDWWTRVAKPGEATLGDRGKDTLFLQHDLGSEPGVRTDASYSHEMEIEETTNWLILMEAYRRRTGDGTILETHADIAEKFLRFIRACDSTGNGVPDLGCANTIDDAAAAIQFGREQVYLAVKSLAACVVGESMMRDLGRTEIADACADQAARIRRAVETCGWRDDHFVCLLQPSAEGVKDAWTGEDYPGDEHGNIPGWDAAHIYTPNALAILDMVGIDTGLDNDKIATDIQTAAQRCLKHYGCSHSDSINLDITDASRMVDGWMGQAHNPGWISMNMLRDIAAFYRGIDLRAMSERYWEWQTTTNSAEMKLFFETFNGNNLCMYPRGIAVWGFFDAIAGLVIDRHSGHTENQSTFSQVHVPKLFDADWTNGTSTRLYCHSS